MFLNIMTIVKNISDRISKKEIKAGKIFIYPTDTVYGLGCNALNEKAVEKIKEMKKRDEKKPLSIIAPSVSWIHEHFIVDLNLEKYLPGPYTVILKKKIPFFLKWVSAGDSMGIRIPDNVFCRKVQKSGIPFVTTSVNISGSKSITQISELSDDIKKQVDIIIDDGILNGKPSTLIINGKEIER